MITFTRVNKSDNWEEPKGFSSAEALLAKLIYDALRNLRDGSMSDAFMQGISTGDIDKILAALDLGRFKDAMSQVGDILGNYAEKTGINQLDNLGVDANLLFNIINQNAVKFARESSSKMVVEITEELRRSIQSKIASAVSGKMTVDETARQIRQGLPLHSAWAKAVPKFYEKTYRRLLKDGVPNAKAQANAEALAAKYEQKLIRKRALTIARTETSRSAMRGTYDSWIAGINNGLIRPNSRKVWYAEPNACDLCADLKDKTIGITDGWGATDLYGEILTPPRHPNCRCVVALLPPKEA